MSLPEGPKLSEIPILLYSHALQVIYDSNLKFCGIKILILTYLLTPYSRVLLEKLTGFQLIKKFHAFYGTRTFFTLLTRARHLSLT